MQTSAQIHRAQVSSVSGSVRLIDSQVEYAANGSGPIDVPSTEASRSYGDGSHPNRRLSQSRVSAEARRCFVYTLARRLKTTPSVIDLGSVRCV